MTPRKLIFRGLGAVIMPLAAIGDLVLTPVATLFWIGWIILDSIEWLRTGSFEYTFENEIWLFNIRGCLSYFFES